MIQNFQILKFAQCKYFGFQFFHISNIYVRVYIRTSTYQYKYTPSRKNINLVLHIIRHEGIWYLIWWCGLVELSGVYD